MQRGTDSVCHGPNEYRVSNVDWTVDVPDFVGAVLLTTAAGAVRLDDDEAPEDFVVMAHPNPHQPLISRGRSYHPVDGRIHVHLVAVADAIRRGFTIVED